MNEHIILTKLQADDIKDNYGKYSAIEPIQAPDGRFIIPEHCLIDTDLQTIKGTLETMVTVDNIQPILTLPVMGQPCIVGYYLHDSEDSCLVYCRQAHTRTEHAVETIPDLFTFFRKEIEGTVLDWIPNEKVKPTWKRKYNGKDYIFIGATETLTPTGQTPNLVPALWNEVIIVNPKIKPPQWVTGDWGKYVLGYQVFDSGKVWEVIGVTHTWVEPALIGNGAISWKYIKDWV